VSPERHLALSEGETILWAGAPSPAVLGMWLGTTVLPFMLLSGFLVFWAFGFFGGKDYRATGE
jgi:hypothetical protein